MTPASGWQAQQITEFLTAISGYRDEPAVLDGAVERAAEAMEAEVAAVVRGGSVLASVGFRTGHVPTENLVAAANGRSPSPAVLPVAGVGDCATAAVPVDATTTLLLARSGEPFASDEMLLLRGMGRVLTQALRTLRALDNERTAVEAMRQAFDEAVHQATHDPLTGLPNRSLVLDRLDQALFRSRRSGGRVTVLFADLDRFKVVNDSFGHSVGDGVLLRISQRLRAAVRPHDTVGRLAGDEFIVLCEDLTDREAFDVAERVAAAISEPILLDGRDSVITASIGIAHAEPTTRAEDMLRNSDVAMYRAKERGRSRIELFDAEMRRRMVDRLELEQSLRAAISTGALRLHYQPIVSFDGWQVTAAEALVRWEHPERGVVQPGEFIPLAEESGLILPLGRWVLGEACRQLAAWRAAGRADLRVAVNLSARQFTDPDLIAVVSEAVARAGLPADALWLEITESVLMEEVEATAETLHALKALGVHLAIDDFGTGYSSLSYLKRFPVDLLKIDQSFIDGLGTDPEDGAIVLAIVSLAQALRLDVVAEGVEQFHQLEALHRLRCEAVQGFLLGRPGPADGLPGHAPPALLTPVG